MARPSDYTDEIANAICEAIAESEDGLETICANDERFPNPRTVYRWLAKPENEEFRQNYARARETQADNHADAIIKIADDDTRDWEPVKDDAGNIVDIRVDGEHVQRSRLRIDARKWRASKLAPKKYGDRVTNEVSGPDGSPIQVTEIRLTAPKPNDDA